MDNAGVARGGQTLILFMFNDFDAGVLAGIVSKYFCRTVRRTVIYTYDLEIPESLIKYAVEAFGKIVFDLIHRYDN